MLLQVFIVSRGQDNYLQYVVIHHGFAVAFFFVFVGATTRRREIFICTHFMDSFPFIFVVCCLLFVVVVVV